MIKKMSGTPEPEKNELEDAINRNRLNNKMYQPIEIDAKKNKNDQGMLFDLK